MVNCGCINITEAYGIKGSKSRRKRALKVPEDRSKRAYVNIFLLDRLRERGQIGGQRPSPICALGWKTCCLFAFTGVGPGKEYLLFI